LPQFLTFFIATPVGFHTTINRAAPPITALGCAGLGPISGRHRKYMFSVKFLCARRANFPIAPLSNPLSFAEAL
jgi:hypothetical protein